MTIIAKRFNGLTSIAVPITTGTAALPGGFVIAPGHYVWGGQAYDCTAEGYYVFWNPNGGPSARRIVYNGDKPTLMSSLALATSIGSQDDGLTTAQITNAAVNRRPQILCGYTAIWAKAICDSLGGIGMPPVTSRIVYGLSDQTPTGYFDGHQMLEVTVGSTRQLYDVAAGADFGGLAAKDVFPLQSPVTRRVRKMFATAALVPGLYDCDAWDCLTLNTDADFESEFIRVLQIPGIQWADGKIHCYLQTGMTGALATTLGWVIETKANWLAGSYP